MNVLIGLAGVAALAVGAAVFVIVFVVCLKVLPEMGFTGTSRNVLAFCVAALSASGVVLLVPPAPAQDAPPPATVTYPFLFIPYAALGLTLLLLLLIALLAPWVRAHRENTGQPEECNRPSQAGHAEQRWKSTCHDDHQHGQAGKRPDR